MLINIQNLKIFIKLNSWYNITTKKCLLNLISTCLAPREAAEVVVVVGDPYAAGGDDAREEAGGGVLEGPLAVAW